MKAIIAKKLNMSQIFTADGRSIPVTRLKAGPVTVTALKSVEKDGYLAVQVGFGQSKNLSKPTLGHLKNSNATPAIIREFRLTKSESLSVGDVLKIADVFRKGEVVDVTATSKGKGFAGVMKRHGFHGGPKTHGQSDRARAPGSIGSGTTPGRVVKGKKMAGRMGNSQVTTQGLEIIAIDPEEEMLIVKGAVPGPSDGIVLISKSKKKRKTYHGPQAVSMSGDDEEETEEEQEGQKTESTAEVSAAPAPVQKITEGN
jgi:large subunit ribosomal protein L3